MDDSLFARVTAALEAIRGIPGVTVSHDIVERSTRRGDGEPMTREREGAREVGLLLDDSLCATYDDITRVDIRWRVGDALFGSICIPDYFDLEDAFVDPREHGVTGDAADFLTELHLIECLDAAHWTAFRTVGFARDTIEGESMEIWTRIPAADGRSPLDLRLDATWTEYLDRLLLACGAEQFALTLVPDERVAPEQRVTFAYFLDRFCEAAALVPGKALADLVAHTRERSRRLRG